MSAHTLINGSIEVQEPGLYVRIGSREICMWTDIRPAPVVTLVLTIEEARRMGEVLINPTAHWPGG